MSHCPRCQGDEIYSEPGFCTWCSPLPPEAFEEPARSRGLELALCALSMFRHRHVYKDKGSRRGALVKNRIKDLSASGTFKQRCREYIEAARAEGWRGSIRKAVCNDEVSHGSAEKKL